MTGWRIIAAPGDASLITPAVSAAQATDVVGPILHAGILLTRDQGRRVEITE